MSEQCRYCGRRAATWSGDPAFPFLRCGYCRGVHRLTDGVGLLFKGAFVAAFVVAGAVDEMATLVIILPLVWLVMWRALGNPIRLHAWIIVADWVGRLISPGRPAYYARVWKHAPVTLRTALDAGGLATVVVALVNAEAARAVLLPVPAPTAVTVAGAVNEQALFALLAATDGLAHWAPADRWAYAAGFCAVVGALWLTEKMVCLALPRVLRTRPRGWPRLD